MRKMILFICVAVPMMAGSAFAQQMSFGGNAFKTSLNCDKVRDIQKGYLLAHILYNDLTPTLEERTINRYIKYLDGSKMVFTQADVNTVKKELKGVFAKLEKKDCAPLQKVHQLFIKRLEDRANHAKKVLTKDFKLDKKTKLMMDPEKREYAKNQSDLLSLQSKFLHFQVSNYVLTDEKVPDAAEKVKRSYERAIKKMKDLKEEDMYTNYLNAFGHALDAHTSYFSADILEDFEISMRLSLQGIGATLTSEDGYTVIEALVKGGAADRSGLVQEKDKIIAVGQVKDGKDQPMEDVMEWDLRDVVSRIRGNKGTKVRLKLLRRKDGKATNHDIVLTRDEVKLEDDAASITYVDQDNNGVKRKIGVINLPSFYADSRKGGRSCAEDVAKLIDEAKKKKVEGMVLDLSNNGGGSLSDAVDLAGLFFGTGNVVKQSSRSPLMKATSLKDENPEVNWAGPLVILTSRVSASASEIVAGALKDYGRALVVGADHTFGKGTVQQVIPLAPGLGALKVTIGMFFTPGGFSTQHRGVSSHIVFPSELEADEDEIGEKALDYSLPPNKVAAFISPDAYVTKGPGKWEKVDNKLVETLKKRSETRVSSNSEFNEIKKKIEKRKLEASKEVVLEDSFKESKERKDENDKKKKFTEAEKQADYLKRPEVAEAINVAVDTVDFKSSVPLKVIAHVGGSPEERKIQSSGKAPVKKFKGETSDEGFPGGTAPSKANPEPGHGAIINGTKHQ
jgi:carboxyl-terminal processing protease